ncbi:MAG: hypothetical protein FJW40_22875 [Acidobacteria bacterium]|nr:hypothetical protein [Acidobacteriota bacterium]
MSPERSSQDQLYGQAVETFGAALERLARAYEADAEKRRDLTQDIHLQLWCSFERYDRVSSMPTAFLLSSRSSCFHTRCLCCASLGAWPGRISSAGIDHSRLGPRYLDWSSAGWN